MTNCEPRGPNGRFLRNGLTLATRPPMWWPWCRWLTTRFVGCPTVTVASCGKIGGFRSFSDYLSVLGNIPSRREMALLRRFVSRGGTHFDVGANVGVFSVALGVLNTDATVHAFEPSPTTVGVLRANLQRNALKNIYVHQEALGSDRGVVQFRDNPRAHATNRLSVPGEPPDSLTVDVEMTTADIFVERERIPRVDFVKLDVEGFEADVLLGGRRAFHRENCGPILIEFCPANILAVGKTVGGLISAAGELGRSFYRINPDGMPGERFTPGAASANCLENLILA